MWKDFNRSYKSTQKNLLIKLDWPLAISMLNIWNRYIQLLIKRFEKFFFSLPLSFELKESVENVQTYDYGKYSILLSDE